MGGRTKLRVATITMSAVALAASATAPQKRKVTTTASVRTTYAQAWEAVIDLFSERTWAIKNMDRDSGLITTDWMSLGSEAETFADCGSPGLATIQETAVRFNVRIKELDDATSVAVNAAFRQLRTFDGHTSTIECTSKGAVEALIQDEVAARSARSHPKRARAKTAEAETPQARGFYCASSASTPAAGMCAREKPDCMRARDLALTVVADLETCELVETAQCFDVGPGDQRCAPTVEGCAAQRERTTTENDCHEAK
jgi:hypothetical protein